MAEAPYYPIQWRDILVHYEPFRTLCLACIYNSCIGLKAVFRIRIHLIQIRIQHFRLNTDPDLDPGF